MKKRAETKAKPQASRRRLHWLVRFSGFLAVAILLLPLFLVALAVREFVEWWHFGPAQRVLDLVRYLGCDWETFTSIYNFKKVCKWMRRKSNPRVDGAADEQTKKEQGT